jgi:hypothetical protein
MPSLANPGRTPSCKSLLTTAIAAASLGFALPVDATTFPSLTTIYVGSGVLDNNAASNAGVATSIHCSNVSGVAVQVRVLILSGFGVVEASLTRTLAHGGTDTFSTHETNAFFDGNNNLATGLVNQGVVNVEATNSAVFCTAMIVNAATEDPNGSPLHLVRVNPHPGTVE